MIIKRVWLPTLVASAILVVYAIGGLAQGPAAPDAWTLHGPAADPDQATGWTVNSTDDEAGECTPEYCTLRAAIDAANASPEADVITFNIPIEDPGYDPGSGQWTIALETPLPALSDDGIALDALSQPGPGGAATVRPGTPENCSTRRIKVNAALVSYGIEVTAGDIELTGFSYQYAGVHGVYIHGSGAQETLLLCNEIANNTSDGVHIADGASGSQVGSRDGQGNIISGNGDDGVEITSGATHVTLAGNYIGITASGESAWANSGYGVRIRGVISNSIGLDAPGGGNVISGNSQGGIFIDGSVNPARENVIFDNLIGTDAAGTAAIPNLDGIVIYRASDNEVHDNVIAANTRNGVNIDGNLAKGNILGYNHIGLDRGQVLTTGNGQWGVLLENEATSNRLLFNKIRKNGFKGDYPVTGGVALLSGSSENYLRGNEVSYNGGDGVYIHSSDRNRLNANFIFDNTLQGINNVAGGNQELAPPKIRKYTLNGTVVTLEATACPGCTVQIFSDDDGEGQHYVTQMPAHGITGAVAYKGTPTGKAYTLTATDAMSNTSEFSASPVFLNLSIDDALPHVVVNKVAGDADGPAGKTLVEFTTYVVGYDPTLTGTLELELFVPGDVLGAPTRVFYRDDLSSLDGTAITSWTNPSTGRYRISGLDLLADAKGGKWTRRVVFRFAMPHSITPSMNGVLAYLDASPREVSRGMDWAALRVLDKAEGIVITNRTLLYQNKYRNYIDSEVHQLLQGVYSMAQGSPYNNSPLQAVYYVDAYSTAAKTWDNTSINYSAGEGTVNTVANAINSLKEDWIEDSTPYFLILPPCDKALGGPYWLTLVGDDDVVPFYRRGDPTSDEDDSVSSSDPVVYALQAADYMFTENGYANFAADTCGRPWYWGGVDLYTGRIVGASASEMLRFIHSGMSGPATDATNRAVTVSYDGFNGERIGGYMTGRGFNLLNDDETPNTINNDDWSLAELLVIMRDNRGYAALAHQGHANYGVWAVPDDKVLTAET
ncbi:MAG: CSLREA domain-containing protein, partial [Anaerolineae bacterium]